MGIKRGPRRPRAFLGAVFAAFMILSGAAVSPAKEAPRDVCRHAKLAVVGDLMAHQEQLTAALNKKTGAYDFTYAFRDVKAYLKNADLTIGNLETVFAGKDAGYSSFPRFNTPDAFAAAIADAGFDLLTTANNHAYDQNEPGIFRTMDILDQNGVGHIGTYKSAKARQEIKVLTVNGISFAFLSYTYDTNVIPAAKGRGWSVNRLSKELVCGDIQRAKALNPDFIIILPHMGDEYAETASGKYREWARFMFESGADFVLASHPHVPQRITKETVTDAGGHTRECFADYSLGNFVSAQRTIPCDEGLILNLYFERKNNEKAYLTSVSFIPTWVSYTNAKGAYDVRPLSIYKIANTPAAEMGLRAKDISRAKSAYNHIVSVLLGAGSHEGGVKEEVYIK